MQQIQICTQQLGQLELLYKIQAYCRQLTRLAMQGNFVDPKMKFYQVQIQSKSLTELRLIHTFSTLTRKGSEHSNMKQFSIDARCSKLKTLCLDNFVYLQNIIINSKNVGTIVLEKMGTKLQQI